MDPLAIARIAARESTLGEGMRIRRALPTRERRMVGAWCFLDHIGPIAFGPDQGLHVGAHLLEGDWIDVGRQDELRKARGEE